MCTVQCTCVLCNITASIHCVSQQMKELEEEFSKLPPTPPAPSRLLRSQQAVAQATPTGGDTASGGLEGTQELYM